MVPPFSQRSSVETKESHAPAAAERKSAVGAAGDDEDLYDESRIDGESKTMLARSDPIMCSRRCCCCVCACGRAAGENNDLMQTHTDLCSTILREEDMIIEVRLLRVHSTCRRPQPSSRVPLQSHRAQIDYTMKLVKQVRAHVSVLSFSILGSRVQEMEILKKFDVLACSVGACGDPFRVHADVVCRCRRVRQQSRRVASQEDGQVCDWLSRFCTCAAADVAVVACCAASAICGPSCRRSSSTCTRRRCSRTT